MAAPVIRVAVVDDHPLVREGTAAIVARQDDMGIAGVAGSLDELRPMLASASVDVLLLDLRLGQESGFELLRSADGPMPAVVVLTSYDYPQYADAALRLGAAGFVVKTAPTAELLDAIRRAAAGGLAFGVRPGGGVALSDREREVVGLVAEGASNDEIGARLGISSRTVESHLRRLFERVGAASRAELAARAFREGWLEEVR
ncbi:MAG TPA: response regulator transcription factor [Candidatus Limnocylindria bacterium]|nr:response regulator transcription factor [Candidatus Limnocylindria bacterium]